MLPIGDGQFRRLPNGVSGTLPPADGGIGAVYPRCKADSHQRRFFSKGSSRSPFAHKRAKAFLVGLPTATSFPVVVQQFLRRGEFRHVNIIHPHKARPGKMRGRPSSQNRPTVRAIVEPHVDDTPGV